MKRPAKIPVMLERDVVKVIMDYCDAEGIFIFRRNVGAIRIEERYIRFAKVGMADLWGIYKGQHFECEVKRPGEVPSQRQYDWLNYCADRGAIAFWADSLDMFVKALKEKA